MAKKSRQSYSFRDGIEKPNHIGTTLSDDLIQRLDRYCVQEERTRAYVMRRALSEFLERTGK